MQMGGPNNAQGHGPTGAQNNAIWGDPMRQNKTTCPEAYTGMNDTYDPRVVYSKEPWNNPLKQTTGLCGIPPDHKWRKKLITLYTAILDELRMIPESSMSRQSNENIYREFLRIVTNVGDTDWRIVERKIGLGQVENMIIYAMDDRENVQMEAEQKSWLIPIETVRELEDENRADNYFDFAGPPEPYLSDEEISDLKKIDQQRMAEEQKLLAQDVKKLTGRSSRIVREDMEEKMLQKQEYELACLAYIREAELDRSYELRSDGSVTRMGTGEEGTWMTNQKDEVEASVLESQVHPATGRASGAVTTSFQEDASRQTDAFTDWRETSYYLRGTSQAGLGGLEGGIPAEARDLYDGKPLWNVETLIPNRLKMWEAKRAGMLGTDTPSDMPRGAPAAREGSPGRLIPKWRKPGDVLPGAQEVPSTKPASRPPVATEWNKSKAGQALGYGSPTSPMDGHSLRNTGEGPGMPEFKMSGQRVHSPHDGSHFRSFVAKDQPLDDNGDWLPNRDGDAGQPSDSYRPTGAGVMATYGGKLAPTSDGRKAGTAFGALSGYAREHHSYKNIDWSNIDPRIGADHQMYHKDGGNAGVQPALHKPWEWDHTKEHVSALGPLGGWVHSRKEPKMFAKMAHGDDVFKHKEVEPWWKMTDEQRAKFTELGFTEQGRQERLTPPTNPKTGQAVKGWINPKRSERYLPKGTRRFLDIE